MPKPYNPEPYKISVLYYRDTHKDGVYKGDAAFGPVPDKYKVLIHMLEHDVGVTVKQVKEKLAAYNAAFNDTIDLPPSEVSQGLHELVRAGVARWNYRTEEMIEEQRK